MSTTSPSLSSSTAQRVATYTISPDAQRHALADVVVEPADERGREQVAVGQVEREQRVAVVADELDFHQP